MSQQSNEFDIVSLIELAKENKYEKTVAGFLVLDKIERIDIPKKLRSRKLAVQAMYALANDKVKYSYFTKEERIQLEEEAAKSTAPYSKFKGLFGESQAPIAEEDMEEDFIPEEEPKPIQDMDDDSEESYDDEEEEDSDDSDDDDYEDSDEEDDSEDEDDDSD